MSASRLNNDYRAFAVPYLEAAWITTPNTSGQAIPANTITTLTLNTVKNDTTSLGLTLSSSILQNLPLGTYYFEAFVVGGNTGVAAIYETTLSLYNETDSAYISGQKIITGGDQATNAILKLNGQFIISSAKNVSLKLLSSTDINIGTRNSTAHGTVSTAGADQRTTLKLWKVA